MPVDYSKYPTNWKTEIRPAILERAQNKCEFCKVQNYAEILRGRWADRDVYQDMDGYIYDANTGEYLGGDYLGEVSEKNKIIKVVLTIAHLDHNTGHNNHDNLRALCQRCHNRHDIEYRKNNRKKNKGVLSLFPDV